MPVANLKSEWLYSSRLLRLTPIQRWSFVAALMWSVGEESDGFIGHDDVDLIPGFDRAAIPKLLEQRLLAETVGGWFVSPNGESFEKSQTTKSQLENHRAKLRERVARSRSKKRNPDSDSVANAVCNGVTDEVSNAVGKLNKTKLNKTTVLKEESVEEKTPTSRARATRVARDYAPPESVISALIVELGVSRDDLRREHAKFIDYWLGKSGRDGTKLDWDATWRNWMRTAAERGSLGGRRQEPDKAERWLTFGDRPEEQTAIDW